jgi:transposase
LQLLFPSAAGFHYNEGVMHSRLLQTAADTDHLSSAASLIAQLRLEVAVLRAEVDGLRRANLELRQQAGYWKGMHAQAGRRSAALEQELEHLRGENRKLQAQAFGRQSEKQSRRDRSNQLDDPDDAQPPRPRGQQRGRPGPQRRDYSHLPVREETVELPPAERLCPHCGLPLVACGTEEADLLEMDITVYRRLTHRRRYQRTCACPGQRTWTAPQVPKLIPKGRLGVSVWVEILLDKFASHRPTERLLQHWQLLGVDLAPGTVANGLRRLEPLFVPLYEALRQRNRQSILTQGDETRWLVFIEQEGKSGHTWWLWVFGGADTVLYLLDPTRSHEVPEQHFPKDASGVLLVDRYSAYKAMAQVKNGTLLLAFCWAHVRRDFVGVGKGWPELKGWALEWLQRIRELYRCNRQRLRNSADATANAALRQAVTAMQQQCLTELADPSLREPCRKVLTSLQEHWSGLTLFVEDRRIPLDNNLSERRLRGPAVGRKNYYGSGSLWSGRLAAMLFSLMVTLKLWQINPRLWLRWYLDSCAAAGGQAPPDMQPFLPWNLSEEQRRKLTDQTPVPQPDSS